MISRGWVAAPGQSLRVFHLPYCLPDGSLLGGGTVEATARNVVGLALDLLQRAAPWATVYLAPRVLEPLEASKRKRRSVCGRAIPEDGIVALALRGGHELLSSACHESWHLAEIHMRRAVLDELDAALSGGVWYGDAEYWDDPGERRARAYEHWCMAFLSGCPPRPVASRVDELFGNVWSGAFGAELARKGLAPAA